MEEAVEATLPTQNEVVYVEISTKQSASENEHSAARDDAGHQMSGLYEAR